MPSGHTKGFFYIRTEYPAAVRQITAALERCVQHGFLGDDILGTGFHLHLSVKQGAGAFVCGEETALIHSIEGQRGTPRLRPPFPAEQGLWDRPTLINNVETFALIPWIFRNGPTAFSELGTATSRGTKVFALAGKIVRGGLIEVPMGVTIREIVEEIGGGVAPGRRFKAVQIGGPSGGCVPAALADTPVDYEALVNLGAIVGSGGMVVLDDTDCMVDIARYFLRFTQDQSCGKCTFCRIGTKRMLDIMDRICTGHGRRGDIEQLEQLSGMVGAGSLCGLGKTAPNPVLSTIKHFRDEYEAHLQGRCPAGKCKDLIHYEVSSDCIGCTLCSQHCPVDAIPYTPYRKHRIDDDKCTRCDTCRRDLSRVGGRDFVRRHRNGYLMLRVTIDNKTTEVAEGTTILQAAHALGIAIPTLCHLEGYAPSTSCQVCLVKDHARNQWVPSCATKVVDGMQIDSETDEVHAVRRTALELLFSDHVGDCLAPCYFACPAHMDIPLMLEQIGEHDIARAIATVKQEIALPAVLGRVCSKPCEKGCRRSTADGAVAVCDLKRFVADVDLHRSNPYSPACQPSTGKRVAIVGAGPTGLSAAYYLRQYGHDCVLLEKEADAGGRLRTETDGETLPRAVLDAEIRQLLRVGAELRTQSPVARLTDLQLEFDAVLLSVWSDPGRTTPSLGSQGKFTWHRHRQEHVSNERTIRLRRRQRDPPQ